MHVREFCQTLDVETMTDMDERQRTATWRSREGLRSMHLRLLLSVLAFIGALPAAAQAAPPWSPAVSVFERENASSSGSMAYSSDGRALVAQSQGGFDDEGAAQVDLATRTPAGQYEVFRDVAGQDPQVAAYGQTRAVMSRFLVEDRSGSEDTARVGVSYGRTWGDIDPIKVIDRVEYDTGVAPLLSASEDGRIALLYFDGPERIYLAVREPGDGFERRRIGRAPSGDVALDVGANGDIVAAWRESNRIKARVQRRGHGLGREEDLGPAEPNTALDASVADTGQVTVAWSTVDFAADRQGGGVTLTPTVVRAAVRPPGPRLFEPTQTLYDTGEPRGAATFVAVDSSADAATVAWTASEIDAQGVERNPVLTATSDATRRFSATVPIAAEGDVADVLVDPSGMALVAWDSVRAGSGLFAAIRSSGGSEFAQAETVTDREASFANFSLNPADGRPTLVWNGSSDSGASALRASTRD